MKTRFLIACTSLAASCLFAEEPFSDLSFKAAQKEAAKSGKIILIDFYATWCEPCKKLDKTTWPDPAVTQLLGQKAVALRIDGEKEKSLAWKYNVNEFPTILLIKPDGKEIKRLTGYLEPKEFIADFSAAIGKP